MKRKVEVALDYKTVFHVPDDNFFIHDPGMTSLPDGSYLAFIPLWSRKKEEPNADVKNFQIGKLRCRKAEKVVVRRSDNGGATWETISELPYAEATPIVMGTRVYLFTQHYQHEAVFFTYSDDGGYSWKEPVKVIDRPLWNCQNHMVIRDNKLYWCMDEEHKFLSAVCCDLDKGIMNPDAWRFSERVTLPRIPDELIKGVADLDWGTKWPGGYALLEANVVEIEGQLLAIARIVMDEYATSNLAAVFRIEEVEETLELHFQQYYPVPGAQCKFNIVYDEPSGLFWMASNLPTNSLNLIDYRKMLTATEFMGGPGNERRILSLWYSLDAHNWLPAGMIVKADTLLQSFMYPSMTIVGDNLALLSRTCLQAGNQHDADYATFHLIPNFRDLAYDLAPGLENI